MNHLSTSNYNLADPSFAAKAGETNHVVILIGKTYKVTCDMPFTVVGKSDLDIDEWWEDGNTLWLNWAVNIWAVGDDEEPPLLLMSFGSGSHRGNGFTMFVSPSGLGGGFSWTNSCCSVSGSGYYFSYNCNDDCHCRGCAASGYFSYEGYRLPAWGGSCGCSYDDAPDDPHDDPDDPPVPVGVSASFSKRVIFFENECANTTNEVVPWHSEATELSCSACGGEYGGYALFSISGADNLIQYSGQPFPISRNLQPYETIAFTNVYRALSASSFANEIVITANFAENDTDWTDFAEDKATAVKVEIRAQVTAPENECINRHKFGVLENVDCLATPTTSDLTWKCSSGGRISGSASRTVYKCPIHSQNNGLWIEGGGASYTPSTLVVQPSGVVARNVGYQDKGLGPGHAGGILLTMTLHALPLDVSFLQTMIEEIPDVGGSHDGYFDDTCFINDWLHGDAQGAGEWGAVIGDNEFLSDRAGLDKEMHQLDDNGNVASNGTNGWVSGTLTWEVPCGWNDESVTKGDDPYGSFATSATQTMTIDANGNCQVIKHGNSVRREITGQKFLNGVLQ